MSGMTIILEMPIVVIGKSFMGDRAPPVNRIMLDLSRSHAHLEFWVEEFRF